VRELASYFNSLWYMLNPSLNFNECLDAVQAGENLETFHLPVVEQRLSIATQDELIRALVVARSPLIVRGTNELIGAYPYKPGRGTFERRDWILNSRNVHLARMWDRLNRDAAGLVQAYLMEDSFWFDYDSKDYELKMPYLPHYLAKVKEEVVIAANELTANVAEHTSEPDAVVSLWISSNGFMLLGVQKAAFDIHRTYAERMALPADLDPLSRIIERPRYWHDFAGPSQRSGQGFIRGNGLKVLSETQSVQVNSEFLAESQGGGTRIFLYSEQPFKS
jgi:hypothetical protein